MHPCAHAGAERGVPAPSTPMEGGSRQARLPLHPAQLQSEWVLGAPACMGSQQQQRLWEWEWPGDGGREGVGPALAILG